MLPTNEDISISGIEGDSFIQSEISDMSGDMVLFTPSLTDFKAYVEWLEEHFSTYISSDFINFLIRSLQIITIKRLNEFLTSLDPKDVFVLIGKTKYDLWRPAIIDLQVI